MKKIILIGNSITAEILYKYLELDERYEVVAFAVEKEFIKEDRLFSKNILSIEELKKNFTPADYSVIMAIGYNELNKTRERLFFALQGIGYKIETYIHPEAKIFNNCDIVIIV